MRRKAPLFLVTDKNAHARPGDLTSLDLARNQHGADVDIGLTFSRLTLVKICTGDMANKRSKIGAAEKGKSGRQEWQIQSCLLACFDPRCHPKILYCKNVPTTSYPMKKGRNDQMYTNSYQKEKQFQDTKCTHYLVSSKKAAFIHTDCEPWQPGYNRLRPDRLRPRPT